MSRLDELDAGLGHNNHNKNLPIDGRNCDCAEVLGNPTTS
jgi:hypothetical protein